MKTYLFAVAFLLFAISCAADHSEVVIEGKKTFATPDSLDAVNWQIKEDEFVHTNRNYKIYCSCNHPCENFTFDVEATLYDINNNVISVQDVTVAGDYISVVFNIPSIPIDAEFVKLCAYYQCLDDGYQVCLPSCITRPVAP